jgi:methionyl-tRNA formyltransferase
VATITVESINHERTVEFVQEHAPDVIAVCGTRVVAPRVFRLASRGAVNIHTGITPEYRSADPIFWALYNKEPHNVGVTIHFVDEGIDTGPIIHQTRVPLYRSDSLASIYARCVAYGARLYAQTLHEITNGTVTTIPKTGAKGHAFYSIDLGIIQYLIFRRRLRSILRTMPVSIESGDLSSGTSA